MCPWGENYEPTMSLIVAAPSRFEGQPLPLVELVQKSQSAGTRERCSCQGCPSVPLPRPSERARAGTLLHAFPHLTLACPCSQVEFRGCHLLRHFARDDNATLSNLTGIC